MRPAGADEAGAHHGVLDHLVLDGEVALVRVGRGQVGIQRGHLDARRRRRDADGIGRVHAGNHVGRIAQQSVRQAVHGVGRIVPTQPVGAVHRRIEAQLAERPRRDGEVVHAVAAAHHQVFGAEVRVLGEADARAEIVLADGNDVVRQVRLFGRNVLDADGGEPSAIAWVV